jgi:hypothetical protein
MNESPFEQWYNGMVGFHINSERILDDLDMYGANAVDPTKLRKWMIVCWNNALDAAMEYNAVDLENLKEKP